MAGLMVVELHDRAKRILKKNLNSPQSMETSPQRIVFQMVRRSSRGLPVEPRIGIRSLVPICTRSPKPVGERGWDSCEPQSQKAQHALQVADLGSAPPCVGSLGMAIAKRAFGIPETIEEDACDEKVVEHSQSLWPVDDEHWMPEHAASYERIGESRHRAEIRNAAGFYA